MTSALISASLLAVSAVAARSQEGRLASIELVPATTAPMLADPLEISVTARFPDGFELQLDTAQASAAFPILSAERRDQEAQGGRKVERWILRVLPLALGATAFPALEWRLAGTGEKQLKSAPVALTVMAPASALANPDILGIRGPRRGSSAESWALWAVLAVLLAAAAVYLWRRRKRALGLAAAFLEPLLPPEEEAQKALEALLAEGLWERGQIRTFYDRLSGIVRRYLERRHGMATTYMTTHDVARALRKLAIDRGTAGAAREVLEACDLAKFAKFRPEADERDRDVARARRLFAPVDAAAAAAVNGRQR